MIAEKDFDAFAISEMLCDGITTRETMLMRRAWNAATERAAKLSATLAYDAAINYANGREVDFEKEVAAAIRGDGGGQ